MSLARSLRAGIVAALSLFAIPAAASAQTDCGTITGQVTDQSAAIISGALVKAVHLATNFERQVTTSNEGSYTIPQLPVGGYVMPQFRALHRSAALSAALLTPDARRRPPKSKGRYP